MLIVVFTVFIVYVCLNNVSLSVCNLYALLILLFYYVVVVMILYVFETEPKIKICYQ